MELLKQLYNISAPSNKEDAMREFIMGYVGEKAKLTTDKAGNVYITKGDAVNYPCIVAHMDEVHKKHTRNFRLIEADDIIMGYDVKECDNTGIGADDKNGIWVALRCLERFPIIKVAFFVGEEIGCVGSRSADMDFFNDVRFVLQCDRKGSGDFITNAGGVELCSDEFAKVVNPTVWGYKKESGLQTDVMALKQRGLEVSCCNISCGYYEAHTKREYTIFSELQHCLDFVCHIIEDLPDVYNHSYKSPAIVTYKKWVERCKKEAMEWELYFAAIEQGEYAPIPGRPSGSRTLKDDPFWFK